MPVSRKYSYLIKKTLILLISNFIHLINRLLSVIEIIIFKAFERRFSLIFQKISPKAFLYFYIHLF